MTRDLSRLASEPFDLLVVGGGIHGLASAYDAARRGLRVALVERGDFGSGASFNHQRTVHGGLRSLQTVDIGRAREAILERRTLARIATHVLRPLAFLVGTYRSPTRGRLAVGLAFKLDALLGRDRNDGVEPKLHLPPPNLVSRLACTRLFPDIRDKGLTGGAMWYDYQMVEADRLTLAFALAATDAGAALANYAEATTPIREQSRIVGARVRDLLEGREFEIRARVTLNAAGGHTGVLMAAFGVERPFPLLRVISLVTARRVPDIALAAPGRDGRMLTLVPWHGRALVGTGHTDRLIGSDELDVSEADVERLVADVNAAFPALALTLEDVTLVHRGLMPARPGRGGPPNLCVRAEVLDHAADGIDGVVTLVGVKYTTARLVAERAVDLVIDKLERPRQRSATASAVLPGCGIADLDALALEAARRHGVALDEPTRQHLAAVYGARCPGVIALLAENPDWAERLSPDQPVIGAEAVHAVRHEMAVRLVDVVMRRTKLGVLGYPGDEAVRRGAALMRQELHWNDRRVADEIALVRQFYAPVHVSASATGRRL